MSTDAASSPQVALQVDPAALPDDAALLKSLVAQLIADATVAALQLSEQLRD